MSITRDRGRSDHLRVQLLGPRRYDVLGLDDVVEVGRVIFGDPEGMAFYGLAPIAAMRERFARWRDELLAEKS
jgi:hypothetical protein